MHSVLLRVKYLILAITSNNIWDFSFSMTTFKIIRIFQKEVQLWKALDKSFHLSQ